MTELGYYQSKADPSVCSCHADSEVTITSTYMDDVTGILSTTAGAKPARELGWKYEVKDLGEANLVLGIRIDRDRDAGTITISQRAYLEHVLARYSMTECNPWPTPLSLGVELTKGQAPLTEADQHFMKNKPYWEVLSSVMYTQMATRPDLSYAVSTLSKFSSNPGKLHWTALMHVLQYIKGTLDNKITYGGSGRTSLTPYRYVDADYGGDRDTRCSCSGHMFFMAGGLVAWGAKYQLTFALSMTEAEYMALTRAAQQVLWMYSMMSEVGFLQPKLAQLYGDNTGAITLTKNTKHNTHVKHINIRHHYIRERMDDGDIVVHHIPTSDNLADMFTKTLGKVMHNRMCVLLRLCEE
jgi:Reverse transcriptase (RNA-dependent DNA polymerase)